MRVAFIGQKGIPARIGGVERYVDEVAVRMAKRGHDVFVYVRNHYTPKNLKNYEGVKLVHLPTIRTKHLDAITHTFLATIHALFRGYDVIHYHSLGPTTLAFLPKIFSRRTAVVATYQCQDYYQAKWGILARLYLRLGEFATLHVPDKVISVSDILRSYGLKVYDKDSILIPNGVTLFKKTGSLKVFKKWNLEKQKYFLSVSRLVAHKEIHTLIKAFVALKAMKKVKSDWKLVIAGGGNYTDQYVRQIKAMTRGRKDIILAGVQKGEKLAALYKNAYAFVQPSRAEGLSLALLEAMGVGLAPLVSDIPENLSALRGSGFVFQTGNEFDLMGKLEYLANNSAKVKKMGKKVMEIAKDYYNWGRISEEIEAVYSEALDEKISQKIEGEISFARRMRIF
jgi:glycosyltransferase involved in cell wall biosynthesis